MQLQTTVETSEKVTRELPFTCEEKVTANGTPYLQLESDQYLIMLFASSAHNSETAKSRIVFNASITLKSASITFHVPIKELVENGSIFAGYRSQRQGMRVLVSEYSKITGKSYDRMSVPDESYRTIMAMINAVAA
jgi:hypothetical protein